MSESNGRVLQGVVVSDKMDKTVVVRVDRRVPHDRYDKIVTKSTKFSVHNESLDCKIGDTVKIREGRPVSKTKSWYLISVEEN